MTSSALQPPTLTCPGLPTLDEDFRQYPGPSWPMRGAEELLTAVYQYEVRAGWTLQPNFQYIFHPGGGATNPLGTRAGKPVADAAGYWSTKRDQVLSA